MRMYLQYAVSLELTFAGRHALEPLVINIFVAGTSAVLKPSTARSAAAVSTGFRERATPSTRNRFHDRWGDGWWRADWRGDWCPDY